MKRTDLSNSATTLSVLLTIKLCMFIFSDVEGVLKSANGTEYGLASGVFTKDLSKVCCCIYGYPIMKASVEPFK